MWIQSACSHLFVRRVLPLAGVLLTATGAWAAPIIDIVISEIMYHPPGDGMAGEYIEITNRGSVAVDLTGWRIDDGIRFSFAPGTIMPAGSRRVIAKDPVAAAAMYKITGVLGPFDGRLDNGGERIEIRDQNDGLVNEVKYDDKAPWPSGGDGDGRSIELINLSKNNNAGQHWKPSSRLLGSPGAANSPADPPVTVVINEFLANSSDKDWVELYNYGNSPVDLNGFYLTDNPTNPTKARISASWSAGTTIIQPKGYWLSHEGDWATFKLSSTGEQIYLVGADGVSWIDGRDFGNQPIENASEGRFPDAGGRWYKFITPTAGAANVAPPPRGVVINEIMYHPAGTANPGAEYVELRNTTSFAINMQGWKLTHGIEFTFPAGVTLPGNGYLVIAAEPALVQARYGISGVLGPYTGKLSNDTNEIELEDELGNRVAFVEYRQEGQWPTAPDGTGPSLELATLAMSAQLPGAWRASSGSGTPGAPNSQSVANPPASISEVIHAPLVPNSGQQVTVTARVGAGSLTAVKLYYKRDEDASFQNVSMFDDGLHGDSRAGDGVYGGQLPAFADKTTVEFYIDASATGGNARFPASSPSVTCLYAVESTAPSTNLTIFRFVLTEENWNSLKNDPNNDAQRDGTFIVGDRVFYNCGIRFRSGARGGPKYSYKVHLPAGYRYYDSDIFNLNFEKNDATHLKNKVLNHFLGYMGLPDARTEFVHLRRHVRGSSNTYAGVHLFTEAHDKDYLDNHFPGDSNGNMYKAIAAYVTSISGVNVAWGGVREWYEKETNTAQNDWSDLDGLYNVLRPSSPNATYEASVQARVDVWNWANSYAVLAVGCLIDTPWHVHNQNYRLYRRPSDNRFIHILYDFDDGYWSTMYDNAGPTATVYQDVSRFFSRVPFKREHLHGIWRAVNLSSGVYRENRISSEVYYYHKLIYDDVAADPYSGIGNSSRWSAFTNGVNQWNTWLAARNGLLRGSLPSATLAITTNNGQPFTTASPSVTLEGNAPISAAQLEIFGSQTGVEWLTETKWRKSFTLVNQFNKVFVRALDDAGQETQSVSIEITYSGGIPNNVDFTTGPLPSQLPYVVQFADISTAPNITSRSWDFGDNTTGSGVNPVHTYALWGTYQVKLTVQAPGGPFSITKPIVVGQPIAGDFDRDGDLDLSDFGRFQSCLSGPGINQPNPACDPARFDDDGDVDLDDLAVFLSCMMGSNVPADPNCR